MKQLLIALLSCMAVAAHARYSGRVFFDANANGTYDKGEQLLQGVAVSDGLNVVTTDAKGAFSLPGYEKTRFIFITTPSGYKTYNRHYIAVDNNIKSYDFGLLKLGGKRIASDGSHRFIHISDTEISTTEGQEKWVNNLKNFAANNQVAFIFHTGDICYEKGLKAHIRLMNTKNMDCPVFYSNGNHDLVKGKYGEELFESIYGPVYYSFNVGNVHYIATPMSYGDYWPSYNEDQVARWMKNDLAVLKAGTPVVVFNHNLLTSDNSFVYGGKKDSVNLNAHNLKGWLYGHWHNHYVHRQGKVLAIGTSPVCMGGIDHSTAAYRVMTVDKNGNLSSDLRYTYMEGVVRANAVAKPHSPLTITANAYSSNAFTKKVSAVCVANGKTIGKAELKQLTDWTWSASMKVSARYTRQGSTMQLRVTAVFSDGKTATDEHNIICEDVATPNLSTNWVNMAGNPQHDGVAKDTLRGNLRLAWVKNVGGNLFMSSPLVYKGNVYVATVDENGGNKCAVVALDGNNGKTLWRCPVDYSVRNTITIANGKVFAQDISGVLYTIDAANGKLLGRTKLHIPGLPVLDEGIVSKGDTVYAGSGRGLCAIDARTGNQIWKNEGWGRGEGTTSTWTVGRNNLISDVQWSALYANDLNTGKTIWGKSNDGLRYRASSPASHGGALYMLSGDAFYILDEATGRILVKKNLDCSVDITSTPLLTDKEIIFGTQRNGVMALDNQTLEKKWTFNTDPALVYTACYVHYPAQTIETSPIISGNVVYVAAEDGCLYGLDPHTGKQVSKQNFGAPLFATPAISGNGLVVTDFGGNVYMYTAK